MAIGVVKALENAGRSDIIVVGFDAIPAVLPMIEDGRMLASVDQFGQQMAANAIDLALDVVAGGPELEGWVTTPIELVTK
jgi:ribose transport system substrate-binding protein